MIYPQLLLDLHDELIAKLLAGGGGASCYRRKAFSLTEPQRPGSAQAPLLFARKHSPRPTLAP